MNFFGFKFGRENNEQEKYYHNSAQNYSNALANYYIQEKIYLDISNDQEFGLVGLRNYKNVCYINSVLQCLKNIYLLIIFFINNQNNTQEISNNFQYILSKLLYKKSNTSAICLKSIMEKHDNYFKGIESKDSLNFYVSLLSMLHKELNINQKEKYYENNFSDKNSEEYFFKKKREFFAKNNSIIINIFYGCQKNTFSCDICKTKIYKFEPFNFLDLSIKKDELQINNLEECFKIYQRKEQLEIECEKCKKSKLNVKYEIFSLPKILVISFKKSDQKKHKVNFPEKLYMSQIIENETEKNKEYNLIGFINHINENSNKSHNYCITKNIFNNKWYLYSDLTIYGIDKIQPFFNEAILLIYQLSGIEMPKNCLNELKSIIQFINEKNK